VSKDAKEKAEDAALLQQLDSEQASRSDAKAKSLWVPGPGSRGGGGGGAGVSYRVQNILTRTAPAARALVVRTGDPDPKAQATLEEDLAVMSHLLSKAVEELPGGQANGGNKVMGIDVFFTPGVTPLRSLYLDNYGAVFFLTVNFPLVAPSEKKDEGKPAADSTWEEARQELYGQRLQGAEAGEVGGEDYNQEKVAKLKEALLETVKNATNIRGLKPQEFVTIWVSGGTSVHGGRGRTLKSNRDGNNANFVAADSAAAAARRTVLTLRVTKAEIDDYAKGKLPVEDFQKRARITAYTGGTGASGAEGLTVGVYPARAGF
jgi:hypothetical protein